jgi:hypothetical protein
MEASRRQIMAGLAAMLSAPPVMAMQANGRGGAVSKARLFTASRRALKRAI